MIDLWVGLECTVNRVGNRYLDQVVRTGHDQRIDDIDRIAALGVSRMRYPLIWERSIAGDIGFVQRERAAAQLDRIRELGLAPIAGLMHHGSGPMHTNLLDPGFPEMLAEYAGSVARKHPWIDAYTPVNEPVVTARFSGLYGHWFPHRADDPAFIRMVVNQCRGTVLAMQAIRRVTPYAELVHTDDGGTVFSTPPLEYQASFENHRRDLALDLLFGRVDDSHPLWEYLQCSDVTAAEWQWFRDQGLSPDVIGLDYYATSDRYLDHRLAGHPPEALGGNGQHKYADVAAAGRMPGWTIGFGNALRNTHAKYQTPVALTEVHLGCTREEQLRWLHAAWESAREAEASGTEVRAVTAWALFGTFGWDKLVTEDSDHYEPGAFDVRGTKPRRTAVGNAIASIATTGEMKHPVLAQPGWWAGGAARVVSRNQRLRTKRLLILGARGTLGSTFVRHCESRGIDYLALTRAEVDVREPMEVRRAIAACRPWAVVNATGFVDVDAAERDRAECIRTNTFGARYIADACARCGSQLLTFSTDLVFDGERQQPYTESDTTRPLSTYGHSKQAAEEAVRDCLPDALIIRTSAFFGPSDQFNFAFAVLDALAEGRPVLATRHVVSPTYVPALVEAALDLLIDAEYGLWHLSNQGSTSWSAFARVVAEQSGFDPSMVQECTPDRLGWLAARPEYSVLTSSRGELMPSLEESISQMLSVRV